MGVSLGSGTYPTNSDLPEGPNGPTITVRIPLNRNFDLLKYTQIKREWSKYSASSDALALHDPTDVVY